MPHNYVRYIRSLRIKLTNPFFLFYHRNNNLRYIHFIKENLFFVFTLVAVAAGLLLHDEHLLDPENGLGYALGIIGGSLMLGLLVYPLRKRLRFMENCLSVEFWFRLHMIFGVLGPLIILYHSNFSLGSTNSNIALICMLLVSSSGLIGRYLYIRIHHGLYGTQTAISEFITPTKTRRHAIERLLPGTESIIGQMEKLEKIGLLEAQGFFHALKLKRITRKESKNLIRLAQAAIQNMHQPEKSRKLIAAMHEHMEQYLLSIKRASAFRIHERLFALWHIFHLPLFIMMLLSGIVHVLVVHMY